MKQIESKNQIRMRSKNKSGYRGVTLNNNGQWQARIFRNGRSVALGSFETAELAAKAYRAAVIRYQSNPAEATAPIASPEPAVVEETARQARTEPICQPPELQTAPQPDSPASWPPQPPGHCPRCGSAMWAPVADGSKLCNQCGLQQAIYNPGPAVNRAEWDARSWRARQ